MLGKPGLSNFSAMPGHRKGGAATPQARTLQGIAADAAAFLDNLAAPWLDRFLAESSFAPRGRGA